MNTEVNPTITETVPVQSSRFIFPSLCWGAIIGGTVAAIGIQILLSFLGVGAGLASFSPQTDVHPATTFSEGAAAVWSACALISLFFGGVIAGRFSQSMHGGFVHGIMVWSLTLIISLGLLSAGSSMVLGGALKILGEGVGIGGKAAASGLSGLASDGAKRSSDLLTSFTDEAVASVPTNSTPQNMTRAKRELGFAITRLFAPGNDITSQTNRDAVVKALTDYTQVSQADATKIVDEWTTSYKNLKSELDNLKNTAEQKTKEAADEAARYLSTTAIWSFFGLLIGLIVSAGGGVLGADYALKRVKAVNIPASRTSAY